jgi:hypothetical protein
MSMNTSRRSEVPYRIKIIAAEEAPLELGNLTAFLYDLVLLHDRLLLILSDEYDYHQHLTFLFYRRTGRPIRKSDRLQVKLVTKESPFTIELIIAAAVAVPSVGLTLVKIIEKLADWQEERAIKRLERQNRELDIRRKEWELRKLIEHDVEPILSQKYPNEAGGIENAIVRDTLRLETNEQLKIGKVETLETTEERG